MCPHSQIFPQDPPAAAMCPPQCPTERPTEPSWESKVSDGQWASKFHQASIPTEHISMRRIGRKCFQGKFLPCFLGIQTILG